MCGEGTIAGMIASLKDNRALLAKHRQKRRDAFERLKEQVGKQETLSESPKISEEELEQFRQQMKKEKRRGTIKLVVVTVVFAIVGIALIY